ncbi:hypothetical protein BDV97DRAFT_377305 [Delphinella strobiligena]|nr:hypothetical protein BDV97DRAFT_377305 [Delphinella strobiligena]
MVVPNTHSAAFLLEAQGKHEIRDFDYFNPEFPAVLGSDAAGEVAVAGADVTSDFAQGERVFFQGIINKYDSCTFQQYAKIPAALVGKTRVILASMAVVTGLYDKTGQGISPPPWDKDGDKVGKGKAAIIIGGSASVGQYAIQFSRLIGFERIITNSSSTHVDYLKSLGATTVLDRSKATAKDFKEAAGDLDVEFVQDAISTQETQTLGIEILRQFNGGSVITFIPAVDEIHKLGQQDGQKFVNVKVVIGAGSNPDLRYLSEPMMKTLGGEDGWIAKKKYFPNRTEVVSGVLAAVDEALDKNKKGVSGVKIVVQPHDVEHRLV